MTHAGDVTGALEATLAWRSPPPLGHVGEMEASGHDEFPEKPESDRPPGDPAPAGMRARIIEALGVAPIELDEIARTSSCTARDMRVVLLELDLAGRIEHHPGNMVSLLPV